MREIVLKEIPEGITDANVFEWVSVLVERYHNAKIQAIPELKTAQEIAQADVDKFRKASGLQPKFEKVEEVKGE